MTANSGRSTTKAAITRQRLLDAAAAVFRARGYPASRLTDVAAAAGVGYGTVLYHFESRESLAEAVLELGQSSTTEFVVTRLAALPPRAAPRRRLKVALEAHLEAVLSSDAAAASIRIVGQVPADLRRRQLAPQRSYAGLLDELLLDAQRVGALSGDLDIPTTRMFMLGALNSTPEWFDHRVSSVETLSTRLLQIFEYGIATAAGRRRLAAPASLALRGGTPASQAGETPERMEEILRAAATVFREQGFAGARMSDVAALVGLHTGSLYYYIDSREDLVVRLLDAAAAQWHISVHHELDSLPASARPIDRLAALVRAHLASVLSSRDFTSAVLRVQHHLPPEVRRSNAVHQRRANRVWREHLGLAVGAGQVRALNDQLTTILLAGALNWTVEWFRPAGRLSVPDLSDRFVRLIFEGTVRR